jgi:predicted RNase H-like HicB family nuclease
MPRYTIVIETDAKSTGIWVPDMPGCTTMGITLDAALANLGEAMQLWAEDRDLPKARSIDEVMRDADVASDLKDGAALMLVPFLRESGRLKRANISLDAGLLDDIDQAAGRAGLTRSAFLASAARDKLIAS